MGDISKLKIAIGQMDIIPGQPSKNFETICKMVEQAKGMGAHIIVFPEMCIGGYLLADKWTDEGFVDYLASYNEKVLELSQGIGIVFGNVGREYLSPSHSGKDGRRDRYNMAFFAMDGKWVTRSGDAVPGKYIKALQPNYRMFDDDRYFTSALEDHGYHQDLDFESAYCAPFVFEIDGESYSMGLEICEDLWSGDYSYDQTAHYVKSGCDFIVNISASPWTSFKDEGRTKRVMEHVREIGRIVPLVYVNTVGMQNTGKNVMAFDGGSTVYGPQGQILARCRDDFEQDLEVVSLVRETVMQPQPEHKTLEAIVKTLRRFDQQIFPFKPKWIIGLSGGIDSSVNACLLDMALQDKSRIVGYNLATKYNSDATKANAYNLAQKLGIRLVNGSIEKLVEASNDVLGIYGYDPESISGLAQENIQARIRGHVLSTFAQVEGGVIMNNGNKVEIMMGYATLYGDSIGAISPIGDLTKVRLFDVARQINEHYEQEVVPNNLIPNMTEDGYVWETMPSAELKDAQKDPMKWFYHDWLVDRLTDYPGYTTLGVMEQYLADKLASTQVGKWIEFYGLDDPKAFIDDLEWVLRQMRISVFKRIQMPPNITLTRGSFGFDFRENQAIYEQTDRYRELKQKILEMD